MKRIVRAALLSLPVLLLAPTGAEAANPIRHGSCPSLGAGCACMSLFGGIHRHGPLFNYGPVYPGAGCYGGGCSGDQSPFDGLFARWRSLTGKFKKHGCGGECDSGECAAYDWEADAGVIHGAHPVTSHETFRYRAPAPAPALPPVEIPEGAGVANVRG